MAEVLVTDKYLRDTADAIRAKSGSSDPIAVKNFAQAVSNIPSGGSSKNYGTVTIRDVNVDYDPDSSKTYISGADYQMTITDIGAFWDFVLQQNALSVYFQWQQPDPSEIHTYMNTTESGTRWYFKQNGPSWTSEELAEYGLDITGSGMYGNISIEFVLTPIESTSEETITDILDYYSLGYISTSGDGGEMYGGSESIFTVDGNCYARSQVVGFTFGPDATFTPDYFLANCYNFNAPLTIPATVEKIGTRFMRYCNYFNSTITIEEGITEIPNYFLNDCYYFNTALVIPSSVTHIGNSFLYDDVCFNKPISFPGVTYLEYGCLGYCPSFNSTVSFPNLQSYDGGLLQNSTSFNQDITFPATLVEFDPYYTLYNCNNMTSTVYVETSLVPSGSDYRVNSCFSMSSSSARAYTTGIKVGGTYGATWRTYLPNRSSSPYRKLLAA